MFTSYNSDKIDGAHGQNWVAFTTAWNLLGLFATPLLLIGTTCMKTMNSKFFVGNNSQFMLQVNNKFVNLNYIIRELTLECMYRPAEI